MTPSKTVAPGRLLTQVAGERQTGALMVGGHPGAAVYVLEGRVIYAESPAAPGVGALLTSSGRLAARTWQNALDLGTSTARVGRLLVDQGHLTQGELELCVLGATYDAAYFALTDPDAPAEFLTGATHWLGPVVHIDPQAVAKEARRRARLLDAIFPDPRVDTLAVSPAQRPPRERITVTAPQWELLVQADGQRTPADLALLLGRAGFATVQELRRLAAAGLIELPEVRADGPELVRMPRARGTAVPVQRPMIQPDAAPPGPVVSGDRPLQSAGDPDPPRHAAEVPADTAPEVLPEQSSAAGTVYRPPRLARRKPGAKLPKDLAGEPPQPHTGTDEVLLKRIRTALRALR
ncbi:DUF4388 domain-containing protein [Micromonosporaceae bacterium Da 78-11]